MPNWPSLMGETDQRRLDQIEAALSCARDAYLAQIEPLRKERDNIRAKYRVKRARERD